MIRKNAPALWGEGTPYETQVIYDIASDDPKKPPVHYEAHILKPHSIAHIDAPAHTIKNGAKITDFFSAEKSGTFFGPIVVVKLKGNHYQPISGTPNFHWEVSLSQLKQGIQEAAGKDLRPEKLLLTTDPYPGNGDGQQDPAYALTLSIEAANWLASFSKFNFYGTSWKSTDFQPGRRERPIHQILFEKGVVCECLALKEVPAGQYLLVGFPLPLENSSESPVCPVLFEKDELEKFISQI